MLQCWQRISPAERRTKDVLEPEYGLFFHRDIDSGDWAALALEHEPYLFGRLIPRRTDRGEPFDSTAEVFDDAIEGGMERAELLVHVARTQHSEVQSAGFG